ncbi:MAG: DUF2807 domain-containing protein [Deltaproteobacteria bacterium]|nr:DUF2807 domain-containing protein [Deltaproteobacteria bacterium]
MKTSNKILWGAFAGILATAVIFLVALRSFLDQPVDIGGNVSGSTAVGSREITLSGFVAINLQGNWQAELSRGDTTKIRVEGPEDLLATLSVKMQGESLTLRSIERRGEKHKLVLTVTMPELHGVQTKGVADLTIKHFETDRLSIRTEGVSNVRGYDSRVGTLDLKGRGVSRMRLVKVPAGDASLDFKGVFNVGLFMDGGELTGSLKGVGEVRYRGKTGRISIRQEGPCKITREPEDNHV